MRSGDDAELVWLADTNEVGKLSEVDIHFAEPYSAYQRGTNENTNGLIRRYLPKGTSFARLIQQHIDAIVEQINNRPGNASDTELPMKSSKKHETSGYLQAVSRSFCNSRSR